MVNPDYVNSSILSSESLEQLYSAIRCRHYVLRTPPDQTSNFKDIYKVNSLGFRTCNNNDNINTNVDICYYGCSVTYGAGVDYENIYTSIIDKELSYTSNNFGISGICVEDIAYLFIGTSKFIKMKKAFFLLPDMVRHYMAYGYDDYNPSFINYGINWKDHSNNLHMSNIVETNITVPNSMLVYRTRSMIELIKSWAVVNNIEAIIATWESETLKCLLNINYGNLKIIPFIMERLDFAYDNMHQGPKSHCNFAKNILQYVK